MKKVFLLAPFLLAAGLIFSQTEGQRPTRPGNQAASPGDSKPGQTRQADGSGRANFDPKTAPAIGKISGIVVDSITGDAIPFATITLAHLQDSTYFTGGVSDEKGRFSVAEMRLGGYRMTIDFIGYYKLTRTVRLNPRQGVEQDLGKIGLFSAENELKTVEIVADKPLMTNAIDRKIFNVEKLATVAGGSATDALRNVPLVQVDIDGTLSMRGSENLTVLIDGRPSGLTGAGRKALLENLPASSIESIEIITNPSAKYDPDGTSGIVNIILKKNKLRGTSGSLSAGIGSREKGNVSGQINYRQGKLNATANYSHRLENTRSDGTSFTQNFDTLGRLRNQLDQFSNGKNRHQNHFLKLGLEYQLLPKTSLAVSSNLGLNNRSETDFVTTIDSLKIVGSPNPFTKKLNTKGTRETASLSDQTSFDWNANLRQNFAGRGHQLVVDMAQSNNDDSNDRDFENQSLFFKGSSGPFDPFLQATNTVNDFRLTTAQADYTKPFGEIGKLETGAKTSFRSVDTDFKAFDFDSTANDFQPDLKRTNRFIFEENIYAGYVNLNRKFGKWGAQAGLRGEIARTKSALTNSDSTYQNDYESLFPSLFFTYEISKQQTVGLNYSKRINRPSTQDLNPFADLTDTLSIRRGNPFLKPEYVHSVELSYQFFLGKFNIVPMLYWRLTTDNITRYTETMQRPGGATTFINTQVNLDEQQSWGYDLVISGNIRKWWSIMLSSNGSYSSLQASSLPVVTNANTWRMWNRFTSTWSLPREFDVQLSGMVSPKSKTILGTHLGMNSIDVAITKKFWQKNGSLSLRVSDIFDTRRFGMDMITDNFTRNFSRKRESRIAFLTFTWKFGKLTEQRGQKSSRKREGGGEFNGGGDDF